MAALQQSPPVRAIRSKVLALSTFKTPRVPSLIAFRRRRRDCGSIGAKMAANSSESYATALAEVAKGNGTLESTCSDIEKIEKLFSDPQMTGFFLNPVIVEEKKRALMESIVKESGLLPHTANLLNNLIDMNRIELIAEIVKEFELVYNKLTNTETAVVTSVVKLENQHLAQIAKQVQKLTGAMNVRIKTVIDPSIVADFTVKYGTSGLLSLSDASIEQILDPQTLVLWIRSCYRLKDLRKLHAMILKCYTGYSIVFLCNNLISAYLSLGRLDDARKVFDGLPQRSVVSWTAVLNGYVNSGMYDDAMLLLYDFVDDGVEPNATTFVSMLNLCGKRTDYEFGKQIHACIVKGCWNNLIVDSAIVYFYAQCGDLVSAYETFDRMKERDVVSWTTMISACSQQGYGDQALSMFSRMLSAGYFPNEHTACCVLRACGEEKKPRFGRQMHGLVLKKLIKNDVYIGTSLVAMYSKCGEILDSRRVFDRMRKRNMVTWTSIIDGYARNGLGYEALDLYRIMKRRKLMPNNLTIVSILRACGSVGALSSGREIHAQIIKNSLQNNTYIGSTLVWLYCKCGEYTRALKALHFMPLRDVVAWTAIISGCAHLGYEPQALEFLREMLDEGVEPNNFTYSSILKACASLEDIQQGKSVHSIVNKNPSSSNVFVASALINMYAKCGFLSEAFQVFSSMPERNVVAWRVMIVGYARNGHCREALRLMYSMVSEGFEVDDYIQTTVLTACGDVEWDMEPLKQHFLEPK